MVNRARAKKIRVSVLLSSPTRNTSTMARHQPVTSSLPVIGSGFEPRRPLFLEDDVVVIDTMQPCTSGRSVEVARDEPISAMRQSEKNKRNRLFDPLTAISARLQRAEREEQLRLSFPGSDSEIRTAPKISPTPKQESRKQIKPKEDREVVICNSEPPVRRTRKPIVFDSCNSLPSSSTQKKVPEKCLDIVIRRDFEDLRVVNTPSRKRPPPPIDKHEPEQEQPSAPHVHKSETLTVIIPKRRAMLTKQETNPQPPTSNPNESSAQSKDLLIKPSPEKTIEESKRTSESETNEADVSNGNLQDSGSADTSNHVEEVTIAEAPAEECTTVSDDDSDCDMDDEEVFMDPPVVKSVMSNENIIPFFSDKYVFSNHYPCRRLFIHGQRFTSTEQFYMWTKAKFCKDYSAANAILYLNDPKMIKQVGNQLENFDQHRWRKISWRVMMKAVMAKFKQDRRMRFQLFRTAGSVLAEASPHDNYWGIGLAIDDPNVADPTQWTGCNVMGEILMQIRDVLMEHPKYSEEVKKAKQCLLGCQ
ncbi:hypothetical protein Y032_0007g3215 [Ancylostoma ceylanicum]|uniref:NADAR domain-containing protein n=1 Tax=Ancylostoma ceylanicum TaxID=53326 RepID=A0A016VLC0_9BILA|nr:hypothetical protein Y032_0007g3215 [Ancylostoma ceylanicum]